MKESISERIKQLIDKLDFSVRGFAISINIPQTTLNNIISRGSDPGASIIGRIIEKFPNVNPNWLITGNGFMFKDFIPATRLELVLFYLRLNTFSFSKKMNINESDLKNILSGKIDINDTLLSNIERLYPNINTNWIITGEGEMIRDTNNKIYNTDEPISEYLPTSNFQLLPLHSFDVVGGSNNQEMDTMGYVMGYMPFVNAKKGDIAVLVTGNSMYPTYPSGAYVQIRRIDYWHKFVEFGQVHIIELMDDRRLIKEVRKGSDKEHFKLISHNTSFDEVEVPTDFIRSVWLVLAKYEKSTM